MGSTERHGPKPAPPVAGTPEVASGTEPDCSAGAAPHPPGTRGANFWRVVMIVWVTAFGFLAAYELLWTAFRLLKIR